MESNPWKTHNSKMIYKNPWITVREDQVTTPAGTPGIYGVIETKKATGALAYDDGYIYLVGQYRYPTEEYSWEIIEGGVDAEETPLNAAQRELEEEAGLQAKKWQPLGHELHLSNSFSNEKAFLFLATELSDIPSNPDSTEVLQIKKVPLKETVEMVRTGMIKDVMSVTAILLLELEIARGNIVF